MDAVDLQAAKAALRTRFRALLRGLPAAELELRAAAIRTWLQQRPDLFPPGGVVALFGGIRGEVDLVPLLPWLCSRGVRAVLFTFDEVEMTPHLVRSAADLQRGTFDAWVPAPHAAVVPAASIDVVLVPGLAFGRDGTRLGRGRGYFDRFLSRQDVRARRVGVGVDCQCIDHVASGPRDVRMQGLVTENGWSAT